MTAILKTSVVQNASSSTANITLDASGGVSIGDGVIAAPSTMSLQSNGSTTALYIDASQNVGIGTTTQVGKLTVNGSIAATGSVGTYSLDTSSNQSTLANGGTINFSNFSGILIINNTVNGSTYIYACGGGLVASIGGTGTFLGNVAYNSGITGYTYTNNTGSTITIGIMALRTRNFS